MSNVQMNLGEKIFFDFNDPTNPNSTYMTNPVGATNPNNTIEVYTNGLKQLEVTSGKLIHTPKNKPTLVFGDSDGGGGAAQYRFHLPTASHKLLIYGGTSSPWMMEQFAVQARDMMLDGRVIIRPRGSSVGNGSLQFTSPTAELRCQSGLNVILNVNNDTPGNPIFEVSTPFETFLEVNAISRKIVFNRKISMEASSASDRVIVADSGDIEVGAATDVVIKANSKNAAPGSKVKVNYFSTEVASIGQTEAVFNVKLDASAGGIGTRTVAGLDPTGGTSGDMAVRTDTSEFFVNVSGTWRKVGLV